MKVIKCGFFGMTKVAASGLIHFTEFIAAILRDLRRPTSREPVDVQVIKKWKNKKKEKLEINVKQLAT